MSTKIPRRKLGKLGLSVSAMGLGCMGMCEFYGTRNDEESIRVIHRGIDLGMDFLDTAATEVKLTAAELDEIERTLPPGDVAGERYPAAAMGSVNR